MSTLANKPVPPFGILEGCEQTLSARTGFSISATLRAQALVSDLHSNSSLEMLVTVKGALQCSRPATRPSAVRRGLETRTPPFKKGNAKKLKKRSVSESLSLFSRAGAAWCRCCGYHAGVHTHCDTLPRQKCVALFVTHSCTTTCAVGEKQRFVIVTIVCGRRRATA